MSEVDLIPAEFRQTQRLLKTLKVITICYMVMVVLLLTSKLWLEYNLKIEKNTIDSLQAEENSILQQRQSYEDLQAQRTRIEEHLSILNTLRGGPKAEQMFVVIDQSINDAVWITHWKFFRAGEKTVAGPQPPGSGYVLGVPTGNTSPGEQWSNEIRMEITGQALNHSALADFVMGLQAQKGVSEVKLQNTAQNPYMSGYAISYQISVKIGSSWGNN